MRVAALLLAFTLAPAPAAAQDAPAPVARRVFVDGAGIIRWRDTRDEVRLFGANYAIASSSDFRAAGYLTQDRKRLIDQDVAHFARMGWDGLRVAFWGDWESSDREGNLIANEHLDLMDYLIAKAKERGISILFNPIHTYHAGWPDSLGAAFPGFAAHIEKSRLGTDSAAIAAQVRYIRQILEHVNPYTGVALKDEPAILFIEMINEPIHHPDSLAQQVRYIDALHDAVRSTGSRAITFHNVSQDFRIAEAIRRSRVQGASFGWYPTGLNGGRELIGNHLRAVDDYPPLRIDALARLPRLVYEFDAADQLTPTMYPAMVRAFRAGGVQLAAMFAYDMLETASRNLGWQTHRLNLVYTPRKAMSAVIAAEAMRRLPRGGDYGGYPRNRVFGPFRVSAEDDLSELVADDAFMHAGPTTSTPPRPERLRRVYGFGSSPIVRYDGAGVWFLDRVRAGVWRLEVHADAVDIDDPFEMQRVDKVVTRAFHRSWPMTIALPDLGADFHVEPVARGNPAASRAQGGRFDVRPGVYVLSAGGAVDRASLPSHIGAIGFDEFHTARPDTAPLHVRAAAPPQLAAGMPLEVSARVVGDALPDGVVLWIRPAGSWFRPYGMRRAGPYDYRATVPADSLPEGPLDYMVSVRTGDSTVTFPDRVPRDPWAWDFQAERPWRTSIVGARVPLHLLHPADDAPRMAFTRIGDAGRQGRYRVRSSAATGAATFRLDLPPVGGGPDSSDYTASFLVLDRIAGRGASLEAASAVRVRLRAAAGRPRLHLTLVERDGTSWGTVIEPDTTWSERTIPLTALRPVRGVKLPQGFPRHWNYWIDPAAGRAGPGDHIRLADVERLQLSLRHEASSAPEQAVEVESVSVIFP